MTNHAYDFSTLDLLHERLCLDFANTTPYHFNLSEDHLNTYADLVSWSLYMGLVNEEKARTLLASAAEKPHEAGAVLQRAVELRETIFAVFLAIAHDETPQQDDLDKLNTALSEAMAHMRIAPADGGYGWMWTGDEDDMQQMLWPVAWSAGELLLSDERRLVRHCDGHDCDWLFLDTSRNHSRRWCDMKTCGNRAKVKRHYQRTRSEN